MEPLTLNLIITALAVASVWFQVKMYRIIPTPAFSLMAAAMIYFVVYRIALTIWPSILYYGGILPVFVLLLAHTVYMYQLITRFTKPTGTR